jgi:hypothetical protein
MTRLAFALLFVLAGCATSAAPGDATAQATQPPEQRAAAQVRARLDTLPRCEPGAEVGQLTIAPVKCTLKFCGKNACCNHCSWGATLETKAGPQPVELEQVRAVLGLPEGGLDCEVDAWNAALQGQSVALSGAGCVVR